MESHAAVSKIPSCRTMQQRYLEDRRILNPSCKAPVMAVNTLLKMIQLNSTEKYFKSTLKKFGWQKQDFIARIMGVQLRRLGPNTQIKELPLKENVDNAWVAGRGTFCDIVTRSKFASRKHFSLIYKKKNFYIYDHGSANGTYVNDERIPSQKEYPLSLGSLVGVGVLTAYHHESECVVFIFEVCKEENKYKAEEDLIPQNCDLKSNQEVTIKQNEMECNSDESEEPVCMNMILKTEPGCSKVVVNPPAILDCDKGPQAANIKTELDVPRTNNSPNSANLSPQNENLDIFNDQFGRDLELEEDQINVKQEVLNSHVDSLKNSEANTDVELSLSQAQGLADDEALGAFEAQTQVDETININSQLSYSMTEELIEISDSDDDLTSVINIKREIDDLDYRKQEDHESDDDVIFVENVINRKGRNKAHASSSVIKIEKDDDFTETDMKWVGKLFKTKEECDSFIQSQRESNEDVCEASEDEEKWMELVTNCANEIGQILLTEDEREKNGHINSSSSVPEGQNEGNAVKDEVESGSVSVPENADNLKNYHSTMNGVLPSQPEIKNISSPKSSIRQSTSVFKEKRPLFASEKANRERSKKIKLIDPIAEDEVANPLEPQKKKTKLDNHVQKKEIKSPLEGWQKKLFKKTESRQPVSRKESSKEKRMKKNNVELRSAEKEKIKDERKQKLRELSMREASKQGEKKTVPKTVAPLKVKITRKNRSDFLCEKLQDSKERQMCVKKIPNKNVVKIGQKIIESPSKEMTQNRSKLNIFHQKVVQVSNGVQEANLLFKENSLPNRSESDRYAYENIKVIVQQEPTKKLKSCLKKIGCTFMKRNKPIVAKKYVRFEGSHSIRYYETENRILKKTSSLPQCSVEPPAFEEDEIMRYRSVLYSVCGWNTLWLEESKRAQPGVLPPPFESEKLKNIQKKFSNHADYVKAFIPLLLLELWHMVSEKWKVKLSTCRFPAACLFYDEPFVGSNLGLLKCESLIQSTNDFSSMLREGDLIYFTFPNKSRVQENKSNGTRDSKRSGYRFFGYVEKKTVEIISPQEVNKVFGGKCLNLDVAKVLKLDILVKSRPAFRETLQNIVQITIVNNITSQLILCRAVCKLQQSPLCQVILTPNRPDMTFSLPLKKEEIVFRGPLDKSQEELVLKLVSSCVTRDHNLLIIQGGPGTGKTHVVIGFILQLLLTKQWKGSVPPKILYCSHSNLVVDELTFKLRNYRQTLSSNSRYKLVRYGNLNSINPAVRDTSCHQLALQNEYNNNIVKKMKILDEKIRVLAAELEASDNYQKKEIEQKSAKLHEYVKHREMIRHSRPPPGSRQKPSRTAEENILENADVICTTCISCASSRMVSSFQKIKSRAADQKVICIIDEAMQCKESETIVPLQLGVTHLVLVGDSQQLRPPVKNEIAQSLGINQSLFWRILSIFEKVKNNTSPVYTLKIQYRMNPIISFLPNKIFYQNYLVDGYQQDKECEIEECLMFMDLVPNGGMENECQSRIHTIAGNVGNEIVKILSGSTTTTYSIGIITCLVDQAKSLRSKLGHRFDDATMAKIDVNSIENVQGREYDIVLFLFDVNMHCGFRANVAMTRARWSLIILTSSHPSYKSNRLLCKLMEETTARHAFFYVNPDMESQLLSNIISKTNGTKYR